jgi:flagellar biosynthesis protein FlhF
VPLETFTGPSFDPLLARAQLELGPDVVIVNVRQSRGRDGVTTFELVAGDPASVAATERELTSDDPRSLTSMCPLLPRRTGRHPAAPYVIALVGPTGVGKTTTLAKLASHPKVFGARDVAFLCLDTYRVGAVEQLRTYAEILKVPMEVAYEPADLSGALRRLGPREVILADAPGRGPKSGKDGEAVHQLLRRLAPRETHVVIPAGLQSELAGRLVDQHVRAGATHLLATKLDELPDDWSLFDQAARRNLPMRWIADGQEVPRDLRSAAPRLLAAVAGSRATAGRRSEGVA